MSKKDIITKKEEQLHGLEQTLERLYRCRDLEISNLWQRSVFLTVFLILTLTAYGTLASNLLFDGFTDEKKMTSHIAALLLAIIGLTFSTIWIMMGKASKAWYEVYENAIYKFEETYWKELGMPPNTEGKDTEFRMGNMGLTEKQINDGLMSVKAGAYSPSKLNILIGKVCWTIWIAIYIIHAGILSCAINDSCFHNTLCPIFIFVSIIAFGCLLYLVIKPYLQKQAKSSHLSIE